MLGPLEVISGGQPISLGGSKQRATLGYLLLHPNQTVPISGLLKALWSVEEAPMTARKILQNSIWSLRRKLVIDAAADVPVALRTQPPGYSLDVALDRVDLHLFHQWVREGRSRLEAGEPDGAATLLSDALELWRGPALADLTEVGLLWPELTMLQSMRLDVLEDLFEAQLVCGRHYAVLGELESLVENEPLRERACGQLMRALYRCGRQSDALGVFSRLRARLVEELGLEPSRELQQLQQAILTHDTALQLAPAPGGPYSVRGTAALLLGAAETASQPHGPRPVPDSPAPASPRPPLQSPASPPQHAAPASVLSAPVPTLTFAKSPLQRNGAAPRPDGKPPASTLPPVQGSGPGPQRPALRAVLPAPVTTPAPKTPSPVVGSVLRNDTATVHVPVPGLPTAGGGAPTAASAVRREASLLLVRAEPDPASTDAGELDAVMDGVGTLVHQEIERCGGTVIFSLHALTLALFSADPDDTVYPLRAARAATALRTALTASTSRTAGAPLSARTELRTAIATGALLVSQSLGGGRPPRVYGATVKECEALLALATSDGTQVCDRTREETKEHFAYEEIPGTPVRWKLLGTVDPEPAADGDDHQRELDLLQGVMTHSSRWSQPHLISVLSSEEGLRRRMLGKLEHFAASGLDGAQVLTWNCQDAAESGPFGLHRRIISRFAGLSRSDPPWAVRRKVSAAVQRLDAGKSCINWLVARCTSVLETSNRSPERFDADEWRDVWRYFLEAVAHDGPIVLIIDNLHLEDSATRELVGLLARLPGRIPLTVVAGAEPDILRHADWSSDRRFATTVLLDKPSDDELDCSDESCLPIQ